MGVLVAISIPIFTSQLTKARRATNQANARAAYAAATAAFLDDSSKTAWTYTVADGSLTAGGTALGATDYGASTNNPIKTFVVTFANDTATVTPQDNGTDASYNKAGGSSQPANPSNPG